MLARSLWQMHLPTHKRAPHLHHPRIGTLQRPANCTVRPAQPPTADDVCRALEQSAAENALPVEFFARVIWQESRFDARAVSPKGAEGIAQFMPSTASWHGLADPFNPVEALRHSAAYLRELLDRFGNLGLAAAAYNAGPGRVSAWLTSHRALPAETRNYVALVTGWTADEWASSSPPEKAETTIPQGVPCTRLANLILAPKQERQRIAAYIPRWGIQLAAHLSESTAWAIYRDRLRRFGSLIGDREPIVLHKEIPGVGQGKALHHNHCGRRSCPAGQTMSEADSRRCHPRRAAQSGQNGPIKLRIFFRLCVIGVFGQFGPEQFRS